MLNVIIIKITGFLETEAYMSKYSIEDIFKPTSFPQKTYVNRSISLTETYEERLRKALRIDGRLIFISGASKSGKTVLCHKVVQSEKLVDISGAQLNSINDFWSQIAEKIDIPLELENSKSAIKASETDMKTAGKIGLGLIGGVVETGTKDLSEEGVALTTRTIRSSNMIIQHLLDTKKILVVDDFHYIEKELQMYIARILKTELFRGLRAIIISLPHRSDDAIRQNSDLIGRTTSITIAPWNADELKEIARKGFELLDYEVSDNILKLLAKESMTSPQLMQENCFSLAFLFQDKKYHRIAESDVEAAFAETALNYEVYAESLKQAVLGPKKGGKRKQYLINDGQTVDVYRLILESLKTDPPVLSLTIDELKQRMRLLLAEGNAATMPSSLTISNTINHIISILKNYVPVLDTLEIKQSTIYILDPFLLFYLRWHSNNG